MKKVERWYDLGSKDRTRLIREIEAERGDKLIQELWRSNYGERRRHKAVEFLCDYWNNHKTLSPRRWFEVFTLLNRKEELNTLARWYAEGRLSDERSPHH